MPKGIEIETASDPPANARCAAAASGGIWWHRVAPSSRVLVTSWLITAMNGRLHGDVCAYAAVQRPGHELRAPGGGLAPTRRFHIEPFCLQSE